MTDHRVNKLAQVLVEYSTAVQPGDKVVINGGVAAEPLLHAVYAKVLEAGGHPPTPNIAPGHRAAALRARHRRSACFHSAAAEGHHRDV